MDGPLIPFGPRPAVRPGGVLRPADPTADAGNPLLHRLDPADGARLAALGGRLVWATTWGDDANEVIAPRLGLPPLPVVSWLGSDGPGGSGGSDPGGPDQSGPDLGALEVPAGGVHWKTASLCAWAGGRPFVWLDDEITGADRRWVAAHHPGRALLRRVDPRTGLTAADFAAVRAWLAAPV